MSSTDVLANPVSDEDHKLYASFSATDLTNVTFEQTARGTWVTRSMKIFRSGSFKDSSGSEESFTDADLAAMVTNFKTLRASGLFPNVPVRANHSRDVENVVGYVLDLQVNGSFLVADMEITEPDAKTKLERGTWRARSAEIGTYETNDGNAFYPVLWGVAFVDIPAVEGLYTKSSEDLIVKEFDVDNDKGAPKQEQIATFAIGGVPTSDVTAVQAHIAELEGRTFTVAGIATSDFAAVQAHIDALEQFAAEAKIAARDAFIDGLATEGKIGAPQVEALKEFASTLTTEQFDAFQAGYAEAPTLSLLAKHGGETEPTENTVDDEHLAEMAKYEEVVAMHRRAGTSEDQIKELPSYKQLAMLKAQA